MKATKHNTFFGNNAKMCVWINFRTGDQMPAHWKDPPRHGLAELDEFLDCAEQLEASLGWDDARVVLFADTNLVLDLPRVQVEGWGIWSGSFRCIRYAWALVTAREGSMG